MPDRVDMFLRAEQAAHELSTDLQKLRGLTTGYASATQSLNEVRQDIAKVIQAFQDVAERLKSGVNDSVKAGLPEVVKRLDGLEPLVAKNGELTAARSAELMRAVESLRRHTDATLQAVSKHDATATAAVAQLEARVSQSTKDLAQALNDSARRRSQLTQSMLGLVIALVAVLIALQVPSIRAALGW